MICLGLLLVSFMLLHGRLRLRFGGQRRRALSACLCFGAGLQLGHDRARHPVNVNP